MENTVAMKLEALVKLQSIDSEIDEIKKIRGALPDEVMDLEDEIPVILGHLMERHVAQDAGVVDEDVDASVGVHRRLDDLVAELHRVVVGRCIATSLFDLGDYFVGCPRRAAW